MLFLAGLEQPPNALFGPDVPYVVKSAWLYLVVDQLLKSAADRIDGLIIPVRDLSEAAMSRCEVERKAIGRITAWHDDFDAEWDVWAATPGGRLFAKCS